MDKPVTGSFENGIGRSIQNDVCNGKDILVIFVWDATDTDMPVWSQAFSGRTMAKPGNGTGICI
ncbi:MAG: hypothetical protein WDO16_16670 [Bacteroidota bacterium]